MRRKPKSFASVKWSSVNAVDIAKLLQWWRYVQVTIWFCLTLLQFPAVHIGRGSAAGH